MKKIPFLISTAIFIAANAGQAIGAETITLGSCNHEIAKGNGYGRDNAGEIAAAIHIPASRLVSLAGNFISRVDVGLISRINVREITAWVRPSLDGANLATGTKERGAAGWNEIILDTPYLIEEDCPGLYIGFTYTSSGTSHPVSILGEAGDYTPWLKVTDDQGWQDMAQKGALSLEAIVTGDRLPQYDLHLLEGHVYPDLQGGDCHYTVTGKVTNLALRDISGFKVRLSDSAGTTAEADVPTRVKNGETVAFTASALADGQFQGNITFAIPELNDGPDADPTNNTVETSLSFPRTVLIEEFTTEKCPNCPKAAEMLHTLLEDNRYAGRAVPVCHHAGFGTDRLTRECDQELLWMYDMEGQAFAPAFMFDRQPIFEYGYTQERFEPIVAPRSQAMLSDCMEKCLSMPTHAMLSMRITDMTETQEGKTVTVEVTGMSDGTFSLENPTLTFYTLEDNVQASHQEGSGEEDYYHNHVIRTDNGAWGEAVTFTANSFRKQFSITLLPEWNSDNISFAAFIANRDSENVGNNIVENAAFIPFHDKTNTIYSTDTTAPSETCRYDINGVRLSSPVRGLNIIVYSDGSTKKVFIK